MYRWRARCIAWELCHHPPQPVRRPRSRALLREAIGMRRKWQVPPNLGIRTWVMIHLDFLIEMAMGGPPIAISNKKPRCIIRECSEVAPTPCAAPFGRRFSPAGALLFWPNRTPLQTRKDPRNCLRLPTYDVVISGVTPNM